MNGVGDGWRDQRNRTARALQKSIGTTAEQRGRPAGLARWTGTPAHPGTPRGVPRCASVPGSGLVGSRALWSSATGAIDAQSDFASNAAVTASHRPAARP